MNYDNLKMRNQIADKMYTNYLYPTSGVKQCKVLLYKGTQPTWEQYSSVENDTKYRYEYKTDVSSEIIASLGDFENIESAAGNIDLQLSEFTIYLDTSIDTDINDNLYNQGTVEWAVVFFGDNWRNKIRKHYINRRCEYSSN
jgi:hypothetical protein